MVFSVKHSSNHLANELLAPRLLRGRRRRRITSSLFFYRTWSLLLIHHEHRLEERNGLARVKWVSSAPSRALAAFCMQRPLDFDRLAIFLTRSNASLTPPPVSKFGPCIVYLKTRYHLNFNHLLFNHSLCYCLHIKMTKGPDIPLNLRVVIIAYRFDLGWQYSAILERVSVHEEAIKSLCQRIFKRCQDKEQSKNQRKLNILLEYIENEPRKGRPRRVEPRSALSLAVRRGLQEYPEQERPIAANQGIIKRQALGELDANIRPLNRCQIINIAEDLIHCEADPEEQRPLKRKRLLDKPELDDIARETRLEYCDTVDGYCAKESLLIIADEKQYAFGGSKKGSYITLPRGVVGYTLRLRQRFTIEQWAASCSGDVSISRPHCC